MSRRLSRHERLERIVRRLGEVDFLSVAELTEELGVSAVTIRADFERLQQAGRLIRTHGGALPAAEENPLSFSVRQRIRNAQKERIGRAAAATVSDGEALVLDASTTALHVARHLLPRHDLTVLTTGLHVALELLRAPGITVIMPGGPLWREAAAVVGDWECQALADGNFQRGFFGGRGLSLEEGLTDAHLPEVELKRRLIGSVREVNVILDGSKVGKVAFASCAAVEEIDRVYTTPDAPDARAFADTVASLRARGVQVEIV
jgi:DeoR family transcriptional regulator of aga operon